MLFDQVTQCAEFEFVMYDTGTLPAYHFYAGNPFDVATQVTVGCPQYFLALFAQPGDQGQGDAGGDDVISACLNSGAGVGVDHHSVIRMFITEFVEFINRATQIE